MTEPVPRSLHEHDFTALREKIESSERLVIEKIDNLCDRLDDFDRRHTDLAHEREKAVNVALIAAKEKAAAHNELLAAMKDQQNTFYTKEQADIQNKALGLRLDAVERYQVSEQAKDKTIGVSAAVVAQLIFVAVAVISIVVFFANYSTTN